MKAQVYTFLVIVIALCSCKTFEGTYCTSPNYTSACIEFKNKKDILFHTGSDTGELGLDYGKYHFQKETLIIRFKKVPDKYLLKSDEKYEIIRFEPTSNDSSTFNINCKGTWFTNVYYQSNNSTKRTYGSTTNPDGEVVFKVNKNSLPITLNAEHRKSKVSIPIHQNGNYTISVTLNEVIGNTSYNRASGSTSKYLLKQLQDSLYFEEIADNKQGRRFYKLLKIKN